MKKPSRHGSRKALVQSLYAFGFDESTSADSLFLDITSLIESEKFAPIDQQFYLTTLNGVLANLPEIDKIIADFLDRPLESIDSLSYAIIRLATYELRFTSLDLRIAINEATELTKDFAMEDSYRYVNAILDKIGKPK